MPVFEPTPTQQHSPTGTLRSRLTRRALAVITAPTATAALWAIEVPAAGARLGVHFGPSSTQVIGIGPILAASVLAGLAGWATLELLERRAVNPRRTWSVLAVVVLVASLALPLTTALSATAMIAVIALHLTVGATLIPQLRATAATSARPTATPTRPGRRWSSPTSVAAIFVAGVLVAALSALVSTSTKSSKSSIGAPTGGPFGLVARFVPNGPGPAGTGRWYSHTRRAWGGAWGHPSTQDTETFQVASTNPAGPGSIIITGPINAGGIEHPGRAVDDATFSDGGFRIDHRSGRPTAHFDTTTCVGTITQIGTFNIIDATGRFAHLTSTGHYIFRATYTTAHETTPHNTTTTCNSKTMTAYIETINATIQLTQTAVHQLTTTKA
jgi:hypothetical protein